MKRRCSDCEFEAAKERKRQEEAQMRGWRSRATSPSDDALCFLYDGVAKVFAEMLKSDVEHLRVGDTTKIGLAAKWCPSLRSSYDRAMNKYKEVFQKHDKHRAAGFFDEVRTGRMAASLT
jgi:ABC-type xylose transport system substrate-binding protein